MDGRRSRKGGTEPRLLAGSPSTTRLGPATELSGVRRRVETLPPLTSVMLVDRGGPPPPLRAANDGSDFGRSLFASALGPKICDCRPGWHGCRRREFGAVPRCATAQATLMSGVGQRIEDAHDQFNERAGNQAAEAAPALHRAVDDPPRRAGRLVRPEHERDKERLA